jgi:hypothetical protein
MCRPFGNSRASSSGRPAFGQSISMDVTTYYDFDCAGLICSSGGSGFCGEFNLSSEVRNKFRSLIHDHRISIRNKEEANVIKKINFAQTYATGSPTSKKEPKNPPQLANNEPKITMTIPIGMPIPVPQKTIPMLPIIVPKIAPVIPPAAKPIIFQGNDGAGVKNEAIKNPITETQMIGFIVNFSILAVQTSRFSFVNIFINLPFLFKRI